MWWTPIPSKASSESTRLRVGRLTKAHGLKGAIKIELFTDDPDKRFVPGAVFTLQVPDTSPWFGKTIELIELKYFNVHPVAFFKDVLDRTTAESLAKAILWVDHDPEEASTEEDAWYDHQLIGLAVVRDGVRIGSISGLDHFPAQDLLHVATESGEVLVPFVKAIVPSVDLAAGVVTVTPPAGLFEPVPGDDDADDAPKEAADNAAEDVADTEAADAASDSTGAESDDPPANA